MQHDDEKIPDKLYKYMGWQIDATTGKNYTKELLETNQFYFSSPMQFNDPFDSKIFPIVQGRPKDLIKRTKKAYANSKNKLPRIGKRDMRNNHKGEFYKDIIRKSMDAVSNKVGVCCFTKNPDNILMWSHYANHHKGICLGFSKLGPELIKKFDRVHYEKQYPINNYVKVEENTVIDTQYLTKAIDWEYEDEYRIILPDGANTTQKFSSGILTSVICGCNMDKKDIEELKDVLKRRKTSVTLRQAERNLYKFGLNIDQVIGTYGG